jgi:hypothetical protein
MTSTASHLLIIVVRPAVFGWEEKEGEEEEDFEDSSA